VKLGIHAALGASDQAPEIPFFTPRLEAVRWALRYVASIMTVRGSARWADNLGVALISYATHEEAMEAFKQQTGLVASPESWEAYFDPLAM
jgi:hypothetical protein